MRGIYKTYAPQTAHMPANPLNNKHIIIELLFRLIFSRFSVKNTRRSAASPAFFALKPKIINSE